MPSVRDLDRIGRAGRRSQDRMGSTKRCGRAERWGAWQSGIEMNLCDDEGCTAVERVGWSALPLRLR
eukprot:3678142-Rhodomonas_salina.1